MNMKPKKYSQKTQKIIGILRNLIALIIAVSCFLSANCVFANSSVGFKVRQEKSNINGVLVSQPSSEDMEIVKFLKDNNISNIQEYAQWLQKNISFRVDQGSDQWAKPLETIERKFGDCEDFSFLNTAVLRVMGYDPKFVAFFSSSVKNHAITVFEDNGKLYYFDNMNLKKVEESNMLDFAKNKMEKNRYFASKKLDVNSKKWELLYKTS